MGFQKRYNFRSQESKFFVFEGANWFFTYSWNEYERRWRKEREEEEEEEEDRFGHCIESSSSSENDNNEDDEFEDVEYVAKRFCKFLSK